MANGGKKRGRKKSVAYCSVCEVKMRIQDSYVVGEKKYACKKCYKKIVKQKRSNNGPCPNCSCSKGVSNCEWNNAKYKGANCEYKNAKYYINVLYI